MKKSIGMLAILLGVMLSLPVLADETPSGSNGTTGNNTNMQQTQQMRDANQRVGADEMKARKDNHQEEMRSWHQRHREEMKDRREHRREEMKERREHRHPNGEMHPAGTPGAQSMPASPSTTAAPTPSTPAQ